MKKKLNVLKNKEFTNAGWIIGEQVFQMLISLIIGLLTARYLGPNNYGALNYTASFINFFIPIATLGMDGVVIKKLVKNPDKEGVYLGSCIIYRFLASLLSIISIFLIVYLLNQNDPIKWLLVFFQSFQLLFRGIQIFDSWFQRHLKSKYVSIGKMAACIIVSAYKVYLLVFSKSIIWFAVSNSLTDLIIGIFMVSFYRKEFGQKLIFNFRIANEVLKESYHFILSGVMVAIYSQMDRIMIGSILSDMEVGLYTVATLICGMWVFVPTAIINSFRPGIIELKEAGKEKQYRQKLEKLYSGIIWLSLCMAVLICIFAKQILWILYGDAYTGATTTLRIAIWFEMFAMIGSARIIWILCENKNKYVKYYLGIGAIVNLCLNIIMIPLLGINGAAIATLITQITTSIIAPLLFKATREHTVIVIRAFLCRWYFES